MKGLNESSNQIVRLIVSILYLIAVTILSITAVPYAIIRGACNLDYYEDWFDFLFEHIPLSKLR